MRIYAKVVYWTNEYSSLCFRHAVIQALQGEDVKVDIEDDCPFCKLCLKEETIEKIEVIPIVSSDEFVKGIKEKLRRAWEIDNE